MQRFLTFLFVLFLSLFLSSCRYEKEKIIIGKGSWESNDFYNQIMKIIIEEGYEIDVDFKPVTTPILVEGLKRGDIHVNVETWSENMPTYNEDILNGHYEELSINFNDNEQGIFTTKYFAKYIANELNKSIDELSYEDLILFKDYLPRDPNDHNKVLIYGGTTEWEVTDFFINKFQNEELYPKLVENFTFEPIRQTPALNQLLINAYESYINTNQITKDSVWVGYNWKPTSVMGRFEMVLIKDKYEEYVKETGQGNIPENNITVVAIKEIKEKHPEIYKMLKNVQTSSNDASLALAHLEEDDNRTILDTAVWWMIENEDVWSTWVTTSAKQKIMFYLNGFTTYKSLDVVKNIKVLTC